MSGVDTDTLWLIFLHIGIQWNNSQYCAMPQSQFVQAVEWQVGLNPDYADYYNATVAEYWRLVGQYGPEQGMQALFQENQLPNPKYPNIANFVLLEFMRWQVAFGGFRAFAYENYCGWMGGGSYLQVPPPYRALGDE